MKDWKKEYWEGYGNNLKVTDGDDVFAFISSLLADFARDKRIVPEKKTSITMREFFKGTSFEHKFGKKALDVKCAYTNGYNQAIDQILQNIKKVI